MIYDIELLLLINYLEKMNDTSLTVDQREYLSIQFHNALATKRDLYKSFDIESVISRYLNSETDIDMREIPLSVHRWIWEFISQQRDLLKNDDVSVIPKKYVQITDPFVRMMIIRIVLTDDLNLEILDEIFSDLLSSQDSASINLNKTDDAASRTARENITRWTEHEELIDILLSFSEDISDSQRILSTLLDWIEKYTSMRKMFSDLLAFRVEYLNGDVGQKIINTLNINGNE